MLARVASITLLLSGCIGLWSNMRRISGAEPGSHRLPSIYVLDSDCKQPSNDYRTWRDSNARWVAFDCFGELCVLGKSSRPIEHRRRVGSSYKSVGEPRFVLSRKSLDCWAEFIGAKRRNRRSR